MGEASDKDWGKIAKDAADEEAKETHEMSGEDEALAEAMSNDKPADSDAPAGILEHPDYKALEERLTATEQEHHKMHDNVLRVQAEMQNVLRRTQREVDNAHRYGLEKFLKAFVVVLDSFDQGLKNNADKAPDEGLTLIHEQCLSVLQKFSVDIIDPKGEIFDPNVHEAISMVEAPDAEPNTVIEVMQKGYKLHDRIIRPALVIVAKAGNTPKIDEQA